MPVIMIGGEPKEPSEVKAKGFLGRKKDEGSEYGGAAGDLKASAKGDLKAALEKGDGDAVASAVEALVEACMDEYGSK